MEQLIIHLVGDYLFQTSWMANNKINRWLPAIVHATVYSSLFLLLTQSIPAMLVIWSTHLIIDRFRLAKYWTWAKEGFGKLTNTGFSEETPPFLAVWLMIITDNTMHLTINYLSLKFLCN